MGKQPNNPTICSLLSPSRLLLRPNPSNRLGARARVFRHGRPLVRTKGCRRRQSAGQVVTISCSVAQLKPSSREETPDTLWGSSQRGLVPRIRSVMVPPSCGATNHHRHTLSGRLIQCGDISSVLLLASWSWAWNPPLPLCRSRQSLEGSSSLHAEVRKEVRSLNVMALATSRALS